jgi:D-alanyl-D-alanine carboxypeptidase/D-alanyl-D-alanine-endopeptidase (penicillin-binding protein 4)
LLLAEFRKQPAIEFLKKLNKPIYIDLSGWNTKALGSGWSWNDYEAYYMAERSAMPLYGNMIQFSGLVSAPNIIPSGAVASLNLDTSSDHAFLKNIHRSRTGNHFTLIGGTGESSNLSITFDTENGKILGKLLNDTFKVPVYISYSRYLTPNEILYGRSVRTQPTDSLLKPMMHRSDNFFAEQSLLMVSNKKLGIMNDAKIIDTLLKTDFSGLPQKPRWVDGSGLSRYNLFTPQDFVAILNKMRVEFGMDRIKELFPTGGEGTISSYYKNENGYIYAKTGTLSGVVALSGFLYTRKNKLLLFSILVNNHQASATEVRKAMEKFILDVREK